MKCIPLCPHRKFRKRTNGSQCTIQELCKCPVLFNNRNDRMLVPDSETKSIWKSLQPSRIEFNYASLFS